MRVALRGIEARGRLNANNPACGVVEGVSRHEQGYEFHSGTRSISLYSDVQNVQQPSYEDGCLLGWLLFRTK